MRRWMLAAMALGCLALAGAPALTGCQGDADDDDDDDDDQEAIEHACDCDCYSELLDADEVCDLSLIQCVDGCDDYDQEGLDACEDLTDQCHNQVLENTVECSEDCDDCLAVYFQCLSDCPVDLPDYYGCAYACENTVYTCLAWDRLCLQGCEGGLSDCLDEQCYGYDPACEAGCRIDSYECKRECLGL